jgi:two-component system aerobic respiration control sensor histidine kinase ArcB
MSGSQVSKNLTSTTPANIMNLLSHLDDVVVFLNPKNEITELNSAAEEYFQWNRTTAIGANYIVLCKRSGIEYVTILDNLEAIKSSEQEYYHSVTVNSQTNTSSSTHWKVVPQFSAENEFLGTALIGKRTKLECDVLIRLNSIMEYLPGNYWYKNLEGQYFLASKALVKVMGLNSVDELYGKTDYDMPWAENAEEIRKNDMDTIKKNSINIFEEYALTKDGVARTFFVTKIPLHDEHGKIIGTIANGVDITEHKKKLKMSDEVLLQENRRAEEANHAKSNFLATISHELRTPLNGILGVAEILGRDNLTDLQKSFVKDIEQSGQKLLTIVTEILDFSKLAVSKLELKPTIFDLEKLVRDTVANVRHQVEDKDIKIIVDYDGWVPKKIVGDQQRVMQILANLINNAIKFTEKGYIKVKVTLDDKQKNIASLRFSVEDSGIGIPADRIEYIFDRFTQVETQQYNKRFNGVGLGLAICKQLVEVMGGNIRVQSQSNKGSIFWFVLPFEVGDDEVITVDSVEDVDAVQPINKNRLLLVEDHPINQKVMRTMLTELNFEVDVANSGTEAVDVFKQHDYDLVLMDIGLPDMDGMQVTQKFLNHEKLSHRVHTPVVALTAHALEEDRMNFLNAGMIDVLTKPIAYPQLVDVLKKLIKRNH